MTGPELHDELEVALEQWRGRPFSARDVATDVMAVLYSFDLLLDLDAG